METMNSSSFMLFTDEKYWTKDPRCQKGALEKMNRKVKMGFFLGIFSNI